jgi:outer membrane protein, multidrug efflux system
MKRTSRLCALACALVFGGCTLGPDYVRPEQALPGQYRGTDVSEAKSIANLGWWELFGDRQLVGLIEAAIANNLDVQTAAARVHEAEAQVTSAYAPALPQVSAGTQSSPAALGHGDRVTTNIVSGLFLSWELDLWGRYARASEAARANLLASGEAKNAVIASLVAQVAQRYLELQTLRETRSITERNIALQRDSLRLTMLLAAQGVQSNADLRQAESQLATTESRLPGIERQIAQTEHAIGILLGRAPGSVDSGQDLAAPAVPPELPVGLPAELLERRPDIRQAEQQLVAANANVGQAKAQFLPRISLTGAYGNLSTAFNQVLSGGLAEVRSPGIDLSQPLYAGGALGANYDAARARFDQAVLAYRKAILVALQETSDSLVAYRRYGEEIGANERRRASAREVLRLSEMRYKAGVASFLEVIDSQRQLLSAETDLVNSRLNRNTAAVQLYKALGGGWTTRDGGDSVALGMQQPR